MPEKDRTRSLIFDASATTLPFDHGTRIAFSAAETRESGSLLSAIAAVADRLGGEIAGEILILTHAVGHEKELRAVRMLDFWNDAGAAADALVIASLELSLNAATTSVSHGRLATKAAARVRLTIVTATPTVTPRVMLLERLASAIRLPHMVDSAMAPGQVVRLTSDADLSLTLSIGDRLSLSVQRYGSRMSLRRTIGMGARGRLTAGVSASMTVDVRAAETAGEIQVEIRSNHSSTASVAATAEARAGVAPSDPPKDTRELATSLLEELGEVTESAVDALEDSAPDFFDVLDEALSLARSMQLRAALEASLQGTVSEGVVASVILSMEDGGPDVLRRLATGDLSVLFESSPAVRMVKGTLRDEVQRRRNLQLVLTLPRISGRFADRRTLASTLVRALRVDRDGTLHIDLTAEVEIESLRTRWNETLRTLFTLGVGAHAARLETPATAPALRTVRWSLAVTDGATSPGELASMFRRVNALGYEPVDGWFAFSEVPRAGDGSYGSVAVNLDFRFSSEALLRALASTARDAAIRNSLRTAMFMAAHSPRRSELLDVAWAYCTPKLHSLWTEAVRRDIGAFTSGPALEVSHPGPAPLEDVEAPASVRLSTYQRQLLQRLYVVEEEVVSALTSLAVMLREARMEPSRMMQQIDRVGRAVEQLDGAGAAPEMLYYVIDRLTGGDETTAHLTVTSRIGETKWRKRARLRSVARLDDRKL